MFHLSSTGRRNNFPIFLSLKYYSSKNEMSLKVVLVLGNGFLISTWKYWIWITLLSKIVCRRVTFFHLVYWISVREWPKYTLTLQPFWKLTSNGPKWCNFKMHVTDCLSTIKYCLWETSKEPFSSLLQFSYFQCCAITSFLGFSSKGLDVKLK